MSSDFVSRDELQAATTFAEMQRKENDKLRQQLGAYRSRVECLLRDINSRHPEKDPDKWDCPHMQALHNLNETES